MLQIVKGNEDLANRLITAHSDMMFAGVVTGHNPGRIWVDQLQQPTIALVWSAGLESFQFMGQVEHDHDHQQIDSFVQSDIVPFLQGKRLNFFEFSADSKQWYPILQKAFHEKGLEQGRQIVYRSDAARIPVPYIGLPEPFKAVPVDRTLLDYVEQHNVKHADFLLNYLKQYWGSVENFLHKGYGYAAIIENEVVSLAVSTSLFQTTHGIGVETLEGYRKKGLSSALVQLLLRDLYQRNLNAWWDCMEQNIASQKTAEKAGLEKSSRYTVFWFYF